MRVMRRNAAKAAYGRLRHIQTLGWECGKQMEKMPAPRLVAAKVDRRDHYCREQEGDGRGTYSQSPAPVARCEAKEAARIVGVSTVRVKIVCDRIAH